MKTLMAAIVVAAATIVAGGAALADGMRKAPEPGTWQYQLAMETGTLPASATAKLQQQSALAGAPVAAVEIGGHVYRIGIDTN